MVELLVNGKVVRYAELHDVRPRDLRDTPYVIFRQYMTREQIEQIWPGKTKGQ